MSDPLRNLDNLPIEEQTKILREIQDYLMTIIYDEVLPKMNSEQKIEALKKLDEIERRTTNVPSDDDDTFLAEALAEVAEVLA